MRIIYNLTDRLSISCPFEPGKCNTKSPGLTLKTKKYKNVPKFHKEEGDHSEEPPIQETLYP